jgi:hypothetical protein
MLLYMNFLPGNKNNACPAKAERTVNSSVELFQLMLCKQKRVHKFQFYVLTTNIGVLMVKGIL